MNEKDIEDLLKALEGSDANFKNELMEKIKENPDTSESLFYCIKYLPHNQKFKKNSILDDLYDSILIKLGDTKAYVYEFIHSGINKPLYLGKTIETQQKIKRFKDHFKYSSPLTKFPLHLLDWIYIYTYEDLNKMFTEFKKNEDEEIKRKLVKELTDLESYLYEKHKSYFNHPIKELDRNDYKNLEKLIDHKNPNNKISMKEFYEVFRSLDGGNLLDYFTFSNQN